VSFQFLFRRQSCTIPLVFVVCFQFRVFPGTLSSTRRVAWVPPSARRVRTTSTRIGLAWARATVVPVSTTNWTRTWPSLRAFVSVSVLEHPVPRPTHRESKYVGPPYSPTKIYAARMSYAADVARGSSKAAGRRQMSIDICSTRRSTAANPPHVAAAIDRRDRQTDGQINVM